MDQAEPKYLDGHTEDCNVDMDLDIMEQKHLDGFQVDTGFESESAVKIPTIMTTINHVNDSALDCVPVSENDTEVFEWDKCLSSLQLVQSRLDELSGLSKLTSGKNIISDSDDVT